MQSVVLVTITLNFSSIQDLKFFNMIPIQNINKLLLILITIAIADFLLFLFLYFINVTDLHKHLLGNLKIKNRYSYFKTQEDNMNNNQFVTNLVYALAGIYSFLAEIKKRIIERLGNSLIYQRFKWFFYFVLFFSLFKYTSIKDISLFHFIYRFLPLFFGALASVIFAYKKKTPSRLLISTLIMCFWMTLDMLRVYGFNLVAYRRIAYLLIIGFYIEGSTDRDFINVIKGLMLNCEISIYIDILSKTINLIKNEPRADTFTGYYNNTTLFALPAICIALLYIKSTGKYKRAFLLVIASIVLCFMSTAGTPKGAILAFIISIAINCALLYKYKTKIKLWPWVILAFLFGIFIIFIYQPGVIGILDSFIIRILHRSTDFTNRTEIWNEAIRMIEKSPIIGYGRPLELLNKFYNAHNTFLEILIEYGAVGFIAFIAFNLIYILDIGKHKNDIYKIVFIGLLFAMHLTFIVDFYSRDQLYYLMIFLIYHSSHIIRRDLK